MQRLRYSSVAIRRYIVWSSALKCVVNGARERAAVERLQHRRLDLDEPVVVEVAADRGHDLRPRDEELARLLVGHQVELAPAIAGLDVRAGRGACPAAGAATSPARVKSSTRIVSSPRRDVNAMPSTPTMSPRSSSSSRSIRSSPSTSRLRLQLDPPGAVVEVQERHPALPAARGEPPGDAVARLGLRPASSPACAPRTLAIARRPRTRAGTARCPARAGARACARRSGERGSSAIEAEHPRGRCRSW